MKKRALKRSFCWFIALVLPLVLILGVLPCAAQEEGPPTLQEVIDQNIPIQVGNLTFSGFHLVDSSAFPYDNNEITPPLAANITVEKVGEGTTSPGLKFTPKFDLKVGPNSGSAPLFNKKIQFFYQVKADGGGGLIAASALILNPGVVEAQGTSTTVLVEDVAGQMDNLVYQSKYLDAASGEYLLEERLRVETNISRSPAVSPNIILGLTVYPPGGEASIESFEQTFTLAPADGAPIADAGPDQVVQDSVLLDGTGSEGNGLTYKWSLVPRDPSLPIITPDPTMNSTLEVNELAKSLYDVTLTVTDGNGLVDTDTMLLAAAGPAGSQPPAPPPTSDELKLWNLNIKKYRFSNWASASVHGTFDASDLPLSNCKDESGLKAIVTLQVVDSAGKALGEWSGETGAEIYNSWYKCVIRKRH